MLHRGWAVAAVLLLTAPAWAQDFTADEQIQVDALTERAGNLSHAELTQWAGAYKEALEATLGQEDTLDDELAKAADGAKAEVQGRIDALGERQSRLVARLRALILVMSDKGINVGDLQALIVKVEGTIALEDMSADMALSLADEWFQKGRDWVVDKGPRIVVDILLFFVILLFAKIGARILGRIAKATMASSKLKVSALLREFFVNVVTKVVFFAGLLIAIGSIGIDIGPLLAGVGVAGFVIGFALQGTLSNFASGVMILLYRPYDVGDVIDAAGVRGKVESMSLVSTTIGTPDNQVVVVPNGSIWGGVITNVTARSTRRVDLTIGIGYDDDLDHAEKVILEEVKAHPKVLESPEPVVKLANLGDSCVDIMVRPWAKTSDYGGVKGDLMKSIKQRLDKEGISIPFPQRDVHLIPAEAAAQ